MKQYYIYRYVYKNEIVYVGQTQNLEKRILQHSEETRFLGLKKIQYFIVDSKEKADANERYFILKYHPPLNRTFHQPKNQELIIYNPVWIKYNYKGSYSIPYIQNKRSLKREQILQNYSYYPLDFKNSKKGNRTLDVPCYHYEGITFVLIKDVEHLVSKTKRFYHIK